MSMRGRTIAAWVAAGILGVGVGAGVVTSIAGAASADGTSPSPEANASPSQGQGTQGPWHRGGRMGRGFGLGGFGLLGRTLHGEATVQTPSGGTSVLVMQRGSVTSTTGSTVTVTSTDTYRATYTVDADTKIIKNGAEVKLADLAKDDQVSVVAVKSGSTLTARTILDGKPGAGRPGGWGHGPGGRGHGQQGNQGSSTATPSGATSTA